MLLLVFSIVGIFSCEKEEPEYLENTDLKFNQFKNPKQFFTPKCKTSLKFKLKTNEDQLGQFASTEMVEFRGKIWSVGGYLNGSSYPNQTNGVWSSTNGYNWQSVTFNAFDSRVGHTLTVFDDKLWVIGGINNAGNYLSEVWYSNDGRNWRLATNTPAFSFIAGHNTIVFKDHLVVFKKNDIWVSPDGINWKMIAKDIFSERDYSEFVLFNDEMYIIGGEYSASTYFNEIWKSSDGKNWSQVSTSGTIFSPRSRFSITKYRDQVWLIGGTQATGYDSDEIWYSKNMKDWCKFNGATPFTNISSHSSLLVGDSIWVFGGFASFGMSGAIWSIRQY